MGVSTDCRNFFQYPLLFQERVKLRTSDFVCTFLVSIGKKFVKNFGKSSRGLVRNLEIFQGTHYVAHRAVVFAIKSSLTTARCFLVLLPLGEMKMCIYVYLFVCTSVCLSVCP